MSNIFKTDQLNDENRYYTNKIQREQAKAFILPMLCMVLLILELSLNLFLNIDTFIIVILTFVLSAFLNVYMIYNLKKTKMLLGVIFTSNNNNISVKEFFEMTEDEIRSLEVIRVSWKSFKTEWLMIIISCYVCLGVVFASYGINHH